MYAKSSNHGNNENSSFFRILGLRDDRRTVARACHFSLDNRVGSGLPRTFAQIHAFLNIRKERRKRKRKKMNGKTRSFRLPNITAKYIVFLPCTLSVEFSNLRISRTRVKTTGSVTRDARSPSEKPRARAFEHRWAVNERS